MGLKRVLAGDVEERLLPAAVEGGVHVVEERDQRTNVLDGDSVSVKVEEDGSFVLK
jgi:hypothetical protein